jgi:hypothetical protein
MKTILFLLGMLASSFSFSYPQQPAMTQKPLVPDTFVHVHWHKNIDEISKVCPITGYTIVYACSTWKIYTDVNMTVCDINTVMPNDFNDIFWLITLGHEFFHCLGANHG